LIAIDLSQWIGYLGYYVLDIDWLAQFIAPR
jgi:hypothetical protein